MDKIDFHTLTYCLEIVIGDEMKYIVANWKSNKKFEDVWLWFDGFKQFFYPVEGEEIVLAPSFPYLYEAQKKKLELGLTQLKLAAQDISPFPFGAYTGAVSAEMLKGVVNYAIVGHSERRAYFHETNQEIANKVHQLHEQAITPILCVDADYAKEQIRSLEQTDVSNLIVAYEPLSAIGSGKPQEPEEVKKVVAEIAELLEKETPILYGGSVNPDNAHSYLKLESVSGLLVGGASLDPEKFAKLAGKAI